MYPETSFSQYLPEALPCTEKYSISQRRLRKEKVKIKEKKANSQVSRLNHTDKIIRQDGLKAKFCAFCVFFPETFIKILNNSFVNPVLMGLLRIIQSLMNV